jgi:hypothetical protein
MIDAMKQALEALDYAADIVYSKKDDDIIGVARKSLRQAIAEAEQWDTSEMAHRSGGLSVEQEPVAWVSDADFVEGQFVEGRVRRVWWECNTGVGQPLYTAPPKREWVGLTEEEIKGILDCGRGGLVDIKKAEQILRERNT